LIGDDTGHTGSGSDTTPVSAAPDMRIVKTDGGLTAVPGGLITYTLAYTNSGNQSALGVIVTETVPAQSTFHQAGSTAGWSCANGAAAGTACALAVGSVAGGNGSGSATFIVTVVSPLPAGVTQITNTAVIDNGGVPDATPGDNTSTVVTSVTGRPDMRLTKTAVGSGATPGDVLSYTLAYTNTGNIDATGVTITETVPANTAFQAGSSTAGWGCANGAAAGTLCPLAIGTVTGSGGSGRVAFAVTVANPLPANVTSITNTAVVGDDGQNGTDLTPNNNSSTATTPIKPPTAVTLLYFRVDGVHGEQVALTWATAAELDNFGFNLYRAAVNDPSKAQLIHFEPAAAKGSGPGAVYAYTDPVPGNGTWWYWLADIDLGGVESTRTLHPAIQAQVGPGHPIYLPVVTR
jgi:uncharacterized repeat protein (TIGR01451 family)